MSKLEKAISLVKSRGQFWDLDLLLSINPKNITRAEESLIDNILEN